MSDLYKRIASVKIGNRVFTFPPFSVEFDQTIKIGVPTTTTLKLYNPAPDTIKACEATGAGLAKKYPQVTIDAGYEEEHGTCVIGSVYKYEVKKQGADRVLECNISDQTMNWQNAIINKTWKKTSGSVILKDMLASLGITASVSLGTDKTYVTFTATTFRSAVQKIITDTKSEYIFKNGTFEATPKTKKNTTNVYLLTPETGLLDVPKKTTTGWQFKTLFFYKLNGGDYVKLKTSTIDAILKIVSGKKSFSTFGDAVGEWEGVQ